MRITTINILFKDKPGITSLTVIEKPEDAFLTLAMSPSRTHANRSLRKLLATVRAEPAKTYMLK